MKTFDPALHADSLRSERAYHIQPSLDPAFTPHLGALVEMLTYARLTTLQAVHDLPEEALWQTAPGFSNSIGTLLAHVAAVERTYHLLSFEGRDVTPEQDGAVYWGLTMGQEGTPPSRLPTLDELRADLAAARAETLRVFATKDDGWLAQPMAEGWANHHWAWFHVMEDEVSHRGQMRLLRQVVAPGEGA
ncbi:MAG: DinB family protein [Deinococcus sp.]|uniref:DinB family protein n=1 Tax=Deinococcus sp. TaxID=47478 RepID=UPI0026DBF2A0|nr:DinB family protein [Deinococcus sp.]MDO4246844.1 DinB family protein [Deinococcus sp.]